MISWLNWRRWLYIYTRDLW